MYSGLRREGRLMKGKFGREINVNPTMYVCTIYIEPEIRARIGAKYGTPGFGRLRRESLLHLMVSPKPKYSYSHSY